MIVGVEGIEPPSPEGTCFTDRAASTYSLYSVIIHQFKDEDDNGTYCNSMRQF